MSAPLLGFMATFGRIIAILLDHCSCNPASMEKPSVQAPRAQLIPGLSPLLRLQLHHLALVSELEAVRQGSHIWILIVHQLEGMWHHTHIPRVDRRCRCCLKAQVKVARVLWVDAEGIDGPSWVGSRVGREPFLCQHVSKQLPKNLPRRRERRRGFRIHTKL